MEPEIKIEGQIEINEALAQFEKETKEQKVAQTSILPRDKNTSAMALYIMKLSGGTIQDPRKAEYIMLGLALVVSAISIFLFIRALGIGRSKTLAPDAYKDMLQLFPELTILRK